MRTKAFINELNTFVKEFRTELLIEEDGADDEETWSLLTAMLSAICKTLCAACVEEGNKSEDNPGLDSRAAKVFWGTWQCHRVMLQLLQVGFRKHPCVLPALTLHLFARKASSSKVNKMAARLAILEESAKGDSDHGVSQKNFDVFCSRTVEPLAKRIKALKSRVAPTLVAWSDEVLVGGLKRAPKRNVEDGLEEVGAAKCKGLGEQGC
jgi:hypothetical protein